MGQIQATFGANAPMGQIDEIHTAVEREKKKMEKQGTKKGKRT